MVVEYKVGSLVTVTIYGNKKKQKKRRGRICKVYSKFVRVWMFSRKNPDSGWMECFLLSDIIRREVRFTLIRSVAFINREEAELRERLEIYLYRRSEYQDVKGIQGSGGDDARLARLN